MHSDKLLEKTFQENYSKLYTLAFRMTGNREDSEDILQTSFINAFNGYKNFQNKSSLSTWLYRIVINNSKKHNKKLAKLPVDEYAENNNISLQTAYDNINKYGYTEDVAVVNLTMENCLQMFMNCMPKKYRAVYTLRVVLKLSVKDSAEILDTTESLIKVNLHTAKKIIKNHFNGRCSLLKKKSLCNCRSYASFVKEKGDLNNFIDFSVVREKEKSAVNLFKTELNSIINPTELYEGLIVSESYIDFISRLKTINKEKKLKLFS